MSRGRQPVHRRAIAWRRLPIRSGGSAPRERDDARREAVAGDDDRDTVTVPHLLIEAGYPAAERFGGMRVRGVICGVFLRRVETSDRRRGVRGIAMFGQLNLTSDSRSGREVGP